jgi:hypothetical protein
MSEKRPWSTKSAAHRFGFVACPNCNPDGKPSGEIFIMCAVCWEAGEVNADGTVGTHRRFVLREKAEAWARERGLTEDDITTSPEARSSLANPPPLPGSGDKVPDTEPAPPYVPPLKREE